MAFDAAFDDSHAAIIAADAADAIAAAIFRR